MALKLITAATALAVSLTDAKTSCRIDESALDLEITGAIHAATRIAEHESGRCIMSQTFEISLDAFPDAFELTRVPVASITSLKYYDADGVLITMDSGDYTLDIADDYGFAYVVPAYGTEWPTARDQINAVVLRYVAGYATTTEQVTPSDNLKIKILLAHWDNDKTSLDDRLAAVDKVYA
jgi:uncharacterized phiE125 gp8 family phage protein